MAQVSFTCKFANPRLYNGTVPTNNGQQWQFNDETCTYTSSIYAPSTTIASSTDIQVYGSLTAGEILMALMMFILIVVELIKMLMRALDKIRTKKKYLGYTNMDVEIKEEL